MGDARLASRMEAVRERLVALRNSSEDIEGCALVSSDGFMLVNLLPPGLPEEDVAAMCASLLHFAEKIVKNLEKGEFEMEVVMGERGYTVIVNVGTEAVLMILARRKARLGFIYYMTKKAAQDLAEIVK